jgi:hypothetical protein
MHKLITLISFLLLSLQANADANDGELFRYKLGNQYPINNQTEAIGNFESPPFFFPVEQPVKPANVGEVSLSFTPISFTILSIATNRSFEAQQEDAADNLVNEYKTLYKTKYSDWEDTTVSDCAGWPDCGKESAIMQMILTNGTYQLQISKSQHLFPPLPFTVSISLSYRPGSPQSDAASAKLLVEGDQWNMEYQDKTAEESDSTGLHQKPALPNDQ